MAPVAAVPAGEDWAWTTWPRMVSPLNLSGALCQFARFLGALAVQFLRDVGEEASRGRRLGPRLVPLEGSGVMLFGAVNRSVGFVFSSTVATTYKRIEKVRVSVLETVKWRRAGFAEAALVEHVCVARNVVAATSSRVAECVFLPTKYVVDFGRELAPL